MASQGVPKTYLYNPNKEKGVTRAHDAVWDDVPSFNVKREKTMGFPSWAPPLSALPHRGGIGLVG